MGQTVFGAVFIPVAYAGGRAYDGALFNVNPLYSMTQQVKDTITHKTIAFQGVMGAYSHLACTQGYGDYTPLPCDSFAHAFDAVKQGKAGLAMIPIENTLGGRVADIHLLLPEYDLHIVDELFLPINHCLMAKQGVDLADITHVHSHPQGLAQCRKTIAKLGLTPMPQADTAGSAKWLAEQGSNTDGAIASPLASEIYGLNILDSEFKDSAQNITRFIVLAKTPVGYDGADNGDYMTSIMLSTRNIPASLYKCLGAFATESVNLLKLESYLPVTGTNASFYMEISGHADNENVKRALAEVAYFTEDLKILGTYPQSAFRAGNGE